MDDMIKYLKKKIVDTHEFQLVTARLHQRQRRQELKVILGSVIDKYQNALIEQPSEQYSDYVWVCWWHGEQDMSPLIRECYRRIREFNPTKKVILITDENLNDWVQFPDYILKKYQEGIITRTHFSDLLRMELLRKYGGVWMDITLMTFSNIPESFYQYPVFTGHYVYDKHDYNVSRNRWTSYFWVSRYPNNVLFCFMSDFWRAYWKQKDELIEYFLVDYALDLGYNNLPGIQTELDRVPIQGCGKDPWQLLKVLPQPYNQELMNDIMNSNWMQKLSYRGEEHIQENASESENSFYMKLFLEQK